jgi:antitoxin FitA
MADLILSDVEDEIVQRLKKRADARGVSIEEEHRRILCEALLPPKSSSKGFLEHLLSMPDVGSDEDFERQKVYGRNIEF